MLDHRNVPVPPRLLGRPTDHRGFVVPFFVAWFDEAGNETGYRVEPVSLGSSKMRAVSKPDFRVIASGKVEECVRGEKCWLCGHRLGSFKTYAIGPMCCINRTSAEPPSHLECARYAVRVCPFLTQPKMRRNEKDIPGDADEPAGVMLARNPGVTLLWTTRALLARRVKNGILFDVGEPSSVEWWAQGRAATRTEVLDSIESGLPLLMAECDRDRDPTWAKLDLAKRVREAKPYLPVDAEAVSHEA